MIRQSELALIEPETKAAILTEAIPYIQRFANTIVVVKYGGNAIDSTGEDESSAEVLSRFAEDVVLMHSVGMLPVVVHGGGPQIGEVMKKLGKTPEFRDGYRVTDAETLEIVRMVLLGKINRDIVSALNVHGASSVGLSGEDAKFITATPRDPALGFVGDVAAVDPSIIERLLGDGIVPVIATIGVDTNGQAYNINADAVAGAVAEALQAEKLIFLTDVAGIRAVPDDPSTLLSELDPDAIESLIGSGSIDGGMIPKAVACAHAVRNGVERAHILDGTVTHALLLELFTESGVGTMITTSR